MHILFLTDNFPPEVNAPASRTFEHCRAWARSGHKVTIITCAPNFPKGQVYDGYRNQLWCSESIDGIQVVRVWSYITANQGVLKRTLDYVSYMVSATLAAPFVRKVDIVIGTSPQIFTTCAAYLVSRYKRVPFVFELRDLWPESIRAVGAIENSTVIRWLERLELFLYRKAAGVVAATHAFRRNLIERGIDPEKIAVITNGVDTTRFGPQPKDAELVARYGLEETFVAGYVGTHGMAHALETLLESADRLRTLPNGERIRFLFLGDGAKKQALMARAQAFGLDNVVFIDSVPKSEVPRYWSLLDVAVIHLKRTELFTKVIPSKLFECMAMGIPVLHGVAGESAEIVEREGVGLVFEPENTDQLCQGLLRLLGDRDLYDGLRARCLAVAPNYDREARAADMLDILENIAAGGRVLPVPNESMEQEPRP